MMVNGRLGLESTDFESEWLLFLDLKNQLKRTRLNERLVSGKIQLRSLDKSF